METNLRIRTYPMADYPWPFVAVLERYDEDDESRGLDNWVEVEAEGGDTAEEAVANLRAEHPQAARASAR